MVRHLTALCMMIAALAAVTSAQAQQQYSSPGATRAICTTFGRYCSQAIRVATCESHMSIWAHNGQYLGMFQMGEYARSRYGHSYNVWGQAQAAYRYFRDSGYDWSPWSCKPY